MIKKQYHALGLMSGTSMDGLDVAWCKFENAGSKWSFKILKSKTYRYSDAWLTQLANAHKLSSIDLLSLHSEYGLLLGTLCKQFIQKNEITKLNCIASHGHTIFHQPQKQFTFQLGDGNAIYAEVGVPVVYDFRSLDVQLKGQGAPLVPIGDKLLFSNFDVCLNLGGIANLSLDKKNKRIAFDICFANMGLNYLSKKLGFEFDKDGVLAASGRIHEELLRRLLEFHFPFKAQRPSLAREHFENGLSILLDDETISIHDRLCTFCECIAIKVSESIETKTKQTILITGGGARNQFLIEKIRKHLPEKLSVKIPDNEIIDYKEALVFAFLGILRLEKKINVLKSVTGGRQDTCSGVLVG